MSSLRPSGRLHQARDYEVTHLRGAMVERFLALRESAAPEDTVSLLLLEPRGLPWQRIFTDAGLGFWEQWADYGEEDLAGDLEGTHCLDLAELWDLRGARIEEARSSPAGDSVEIRLRFSTGVLALSPLKPSDLDSAGKLSWKPSDSGEAATNWRTLSFQGVTAVQRVAAVFEIGPPLPEPLPFASFAVKVLERADGSFAAHLNVALRREGGYSDPSAGLGASPDEALADALHHFWRAVEEGGACEADDFVWDDDPDW